MAHRLLRHIDHPGSRDITVYLDSGGYGSLRKALSGRPSDVVDEVRRSGLRGRGGAGFQTAVKWSLALMSPGPRYLICNADEGEPGTFKDRLILEENPHLLIEGMVIAAYALEAESGYIYLRGEYPSAYTVLGKAIKEARDKSFLGDHILGSNFSFDLKLFKGAGAYICGEETALIESLEGKRGEPRIKPPFPTSEGFMGRPTVVNNVETLANIPLILEIGGEAYAGIGSPNCPGPKLFPVSGHVNRRGVYELPMGTSLRDIIYEHAGGIRRGRRLKAVIPGGLSTPVLPAERIDCPMDFVNLPRFGSMLGSGAVIVMDETTDLVHVCLRAMEFFEHESCGKCTPCREGTGWMRAVVERIAAGRGAQGDIDLLLKITDDIAGRTFCPLGEGAAAVAKSFIVNFREEFEWETRRIYGTHPSAP